MLFIQFENAMIYLMLIVTANQKRNENKFKMSQSMQNKLGKNCLKFSVNVQV